MPSLNQIASIDNLQYELVNGQQVLISKLTELKVVYQFIQDVPQFERGAVLPERIEIATINENPVNMLRSCVDLQPVFQYQHHLPKRFAGVIQLQANNDEYKLIQRLVDSINECRQKLIKTLIDAEPNSRKRASLTRQLFPDILYQTLCRKISLASPSTKFIQFSWCKNGVGLKKLSMESAEAMVHHFNAAAPAWQAMRNLQRLYDAPNVFKVTHVRIHPQAFINYINESGRSVFATRKIHSPIIVLTEHANPLKIEALPNYDLSSVTSDSRLLKRYRQIVEGTNLVCRI